MSSPRNMELRLTHFCYSASFLLTANACCRYGQIRGQVGPGPGDVLQCGIRMNSGREKPSRRYRKLPRDVQQLSSHSTTGPVGW